MGHLARTHAAPGLPRGRNRLPTDDVLRAQRERILRAAVSCAAELGFPVMTVADIVRRARVSRSAFYAQFADKEDCLLAATAAGRLLMFGRMSAAVDGAAVEATRDPNAIALLRAGLRAYLEFLRGEPEFATVFYLELPAIGRRGGQRLADAQTKLAARTAAWHARARNAGHPDWPEVAPEVYRALTGATEELVRDKVRHGAFDELPGLEDAIVDLHLRLLT